MISSVLVNLCCCALPALSSELTAADVDLGLFARVVTSDPARADGARSGRLEEFRAEDVFLTTELVPRPDGTYAVPRDASSGSAVGLEWAERRVLRKLVLECVALQDGAATPLLEYWSSSGREDSWGTIGQTPWQGRWEPLPAQLAVQDQQWQATIAPDAVPEFRNGIGVLKIRWRFPADAGAITVGRPQAFGASVWQTDRLYLETEAPVELTVQVYNGLLKDAASGEHALAQTGTTREPWGLEVVHSRPAPNKADRTLLRCQGPDGMVTVAVEDVLSAGQVYVRDAGLYVCRADRTDSLAAYRAQTAARQTILEQVRAMPDQSFDQALQSLWRPAQNHGPTMLSLACDNAKLIVEREGTVRTSSFSLRPRVSPAAMEVARLDFGILGIDTTVRPPAAAGALPLQIAERTYSKGIGLHANAEVTVSLDGRYESFAAEVGVLPSDAAGGTVVFQVDVDGQRRYDSGVARQGEAPRQVQVAVTGAQQLTLRVTDAGDGILNDAANWAQARLVPPGPDGNRPVFLSDLYAAQPPPAASYSRTLDGRWLPIVVNTCQAGDVVVRQRTWVAPAENSSGNWDSVGRARSLGVAEFTVSNPGPAATAVSFRLDSTCSLPASAEQAARVERMEDRVVWAVGDRLLAALDFTTAAPLAITADPVGVRVSGQLPAAADSRFVVYVPMGSAQVEEHATFPSAQELEARVTRYWQELIGAAMQIEVPEPLLEDVYRVTQVHCLMAARNEDAGRLVAPWIAADTYGPLDTEAQPVILGMDLVGHREFARRGLNFFISSYNADGLLAKGYTLMGTGQHLWTLAEHHALHRDRAWLDQIAPEILKSCQWIVRQTEKTKRLDARGEPLPEYGLAPPGVLADWDRYAYYFYANAYYCAGLEGAAGALAEVRPQEAGPLRQAAAEYRRHVLRAFSAQRSQMPVVPLRDGTWVPPCPSSLYCYGLTREFFGGVSATGHDVEVGGNHLIPLGLLPPLSREADAIVDYLEDRWFLIDGIFGAYPADENAADWFNRGGFAKLQPHYARTSDIHAARDDVRPFVRTYFNTFPVLLNRENLTFWEHLNHGGAWNKTHESAWFLQMTRTMLLTERNDELWLAPFVTTHWLQDGMQVAVTRAPTRFGPASYTLRSAIRAGYIEATIQAPTDRPPARIVLRVRHPAGRRIASVTVDGRPHTDFDPATQLIRLTPTTAPITARISFDGGP